MMSFFADSSESEEDKTYRRNRKPFRKPVVLKHAPHYETLKRNNYSNNLSSRESSVVSRNTYRECFACKKPIFQEFGEHIVAMEKEWHTDCFQCTSCTKTLDPEKFTESRGKSYCEMCYNELYLPKCNACTKTIHEIPVKFLQKSFHPLCFRCKKCSEPVCPFTFHEKHGAPYCEEDFHRLFSPKCFQCTEPIRDPTDMTKALGTFFHRDHFVCFECTSPLPANNFRKKNEELYCEECYHKLFTVRCAFCDEPIRHKGISALGKLWHKDCCLRCATCNKILKEDNYIQEKDKAYCRSDWIKQFAPRCGALDCQKPVAEVLSGTSVVALAGKTFHPCCFICEDCNLILDEKAFYELDGKAFCYEHYHNRTCTDCLNSIAERRKEQQKIIPVTRTVSQLSRRSMSPLDFLTRRRHKSSLL